MVNFLCAADMKHADLLNLEASIRHLESQGVDELHFDVSDGHFVPRFGFTPATVQAAKKITALPCHIHLLAENPDRLLPMILDTEVDIVTLHVETCAHIHRALALVRNSGKKVGIALTATTSLTKLNYCLPLVDRVVLLGADPINVPTSMPRAAFERVRILADNIRYHEYAIEIDLEGPLPVEDGARCLRFGAKRLVLDPNDVHGLGGEDHEPLQHYRQEILAASHTV